MRTISLWLGLLACAAFTTGAARGQEDATQQQIDQINGRIQDIYTILDQQDKRIAALEKQISDLRNKLNQPAPDTASADDLRKLAAQVQALAQKQQNDNELVLKELEKLAQNGGAGRTGHRTSGAAPAASTSPPAASMNGAGSPQKGYEYTIAKGDTLEAIARAYRAQGVKVTAEQILAANPGINPKSLIVGKKIFIPDPNAK
ncbi:MAG TPA: LysM peptidoglycan-binding domain-containing protein [Verrucomicrobiae bacterium]|nr:LysM peptidoglycan-binding domain-containing protein [Verrucomicrobiae bacterium]